MKVFSWKPNEALHSHIERVWGWESDDPAAPLQPLVLPGTGADVFLHYRAPFFVRSSGALRETPGAHLICARRKVIELQTASSVGFVAIRFRASSLYHFTNMPPDALADHTVSIDELWGADGRALANAVRMARSWDRRLDAVQQFLIDRATRRQPDDIVMRAVRQLYYDCATISIAGLADKLGVGRRQLERRILSVTGQRAVEIRTASRFQKVMRHMLLNPVDNFLEVILKFGFYDQAHFSRTCKALDLPAPRQLLELAQGMTHFYNPPTRHSARF